MNYQHLNDAFCVSDQLTTDDIALAHALGFKSIICNRPDGEEADQVLFNVIQAVASNSDIKTAYVPVQHDGPTQDDVARMMTAIGRLPKPLLAYCKTGGRSTALLNKIIAAEAPTNET